MTGNDKTRTHTAYAFSRQGRKFGKLLECGSARIDQQANIVHVFMDRGPRMTILYYQQDSSAETARLFSCNSLRR